MSPRCLPLATALIVTLALTPSARALEFEVQAHRGGAGVAPGNSLRAFRAALDLGVDTLEMDLQITRDGVLVVLHDPKLDRSNCRATGPGGVPGGAIRALSAEDLETITCRGEPIARFRDVLALVSESGSTVELNVEIKLNGRGAERLRPQVVWRTLADLELAGLRSRALIQSFDEEVLQLVKQLQPDQRTGLLWRGGDALASLALTGADVLLPRANEIDRGLVEACHARGLRVIPWTVNRIEDLDRLLSLGVDGVITDHPARMLEHLGRFGRRDEQAARPSASAQTQHAPAAVPAFTDEPPLGLHQVRLAAVMPFTSRGNVDTFCTSLFEDAARGMKRDDFPELLDIYHLPVSVVDGEPFEPRALLPQLLQVAREAGADAIVVGEGNWYGPFGNRWRMEVRLIEVNQGRVLWTTTGKSGPAISGPQAKREVVRNCLRDFSRMSRRGRW